MSGPPIARPNETGHRGTAGWAAPKPGVKRPHDSAATLVSDFEVFAREVLRPLHRAAVLQCGDHHLAEDMVQETLIRVWRHFSSKQDVITRNKAYVFRVLRNVMTDHWRRSRLPRPVDIQSTAEEVLLRLGGESTTEAEIAVVRQALNELPSRQREVVRALVDGKSEEEVAQHLGLNVRTVRNYKSIGLKRLGSVLSGTVEQ